MITIIITKWKREKTIAPNINEIHQITNNFLNKKVIDYKIGNKSNITSEKTESQINGQEGSETNKQNNVIQEN